MDEKDHFLALENYTGYWYTETILATRKEKRTYLCSYFLIRKERLYIVLVSNLSVLPALTSADAGELVRYIIYTKLAKSPFLPYLCSP
jgi:hypothetical protein